MIDPSARVHETADLEAGVTVGPGTSIWHRAQVRNDAVIGAECVIGRDAFIDEGVKLGDHNFVPADPLTTPEHIAPVWYFTPFYAMLRAIPSFFNMQVWGVIVMGAAVMIFFALPWLDRGRTKSIRYRGPIYKAFFAVFIVSFLILGYLGVEPTNVWGEFPKGMPMVGGDYIATWVARVLTAVYFGFFLLMPWYTARDKEKPVPQRLTWT